MSTFGQGSRSQLTYVVESTYGVTPSSPAMIVLPKNRSSLNLKKTTLESAEIRSDRQTPILRHGNKRVEGDIEVDFRADDFDDLLESAFNNTFSVNVLKTGTTPQYLSIEDGQLDLSTPQYRVFTGCEVSKFTLTAKINEIIKSTFSLVGANMTVSETSLDSSPTAQSSNEPFDNFTGTLQENALTIAYITGLTFTLDNTVNPAFVLGSATAPQHERGRARVTGQLDAYFQDVTLFNKFVNETESTLSFSMTDSTSGNTYTFYFPKIKYTGADISLDKEQSRMITLPFEAIYDSFVAANLRLTIS